MTYEMLHEAVAAVAARCDGAQHEDGVGFNGTDTHFGKAFAAMPLSAVTPGLARAAWEMLHKYTGQLATYGFTYSEIPVPEADASKDYAYVEMLGDKMAFRFPYDPDRIARVKYNIKGARWFAASKVWTAPVTPANVEAAAQIGFFVQPEVVQASEGAPEAPPLGRVSLDDEWLAIAFEYDPQAVAAVKDIPGRKFMGGQKIWVAPLSSRDQVVAFAERFNLTVDPGVLAVTEEQVALASRPTIEMLSGSYAIGFAYDRDMVAQMREMPGARWSGTRWMVPRASAAAVADWAEAVKARCSTEVLDTFAGLEEERAIVAASKAHDADITVEGMLRDLFPFQRGGVAYTLARLGF